MADVMYEYSPYAYANNNPLTFNDPLGLLSDSANPEVLQTVTVTAKKTVPKEFQPYINFPNRKSGSVASDDTRPLAWQRKNDLFYAWWDGTGAENRIFLPKHHMTQKLKDARAVQKARAYFYKKYLTDYKKGLSLKVGSVTEFDGAFGLIGLITADFDLSEQFVGSMTIDVHVDEKGENLLFILSNTTSATSAAYHAWGSYTRDEEARGGNMNQVYIFKEPITNAGFLSAERGNERFKFTE